MKKLIFTAICVVFLCVGCATDNSALTAAADPGPTPKDPEKLVWDAIRRDFKDPDSVKDLTISQPMINFDGYPGACWYIEYTCRAKNSFGAYAGLQTHRVFVRYDWIIEHY